jgi:hypothetical protein
MVYADRHQAVVAGLEAAIPDAAALVFACLGVALALHGRRALRARALNVASVGASVFMNVIAAAHRWRSLAVWAMPPVAYALASDTLIGVVRSWVIARHKHSNVTLAVEEVTPLAVVGGLVLWLLRLTLAPASTLAGSAPGCSKSAPSSPVPAATRPIATHGCYGDAVTSTASSRATGSCACCVPTESPQVRVDGDGSPQETGELTGRAARITLLPFCERWNSRGLPLALIRRLRELLCAPGTDRPVGGPLDEVTFAGAAAG